MADIVVQDRSSRALLERSLIDASVAGDRDAYDALLVTRLDDLYHTALGILRHEADARDAVQDSCVQAWRQLGSLRDRRRFDAWLGRILVNSCRAVLRTRRRASVREIDLAGFQDGHREPSASDNSMAQQVVDLDAIRRAFLRLRPDERVILGLHHADRRGVAEIADLLGIPAGTAKWRLYSARQALAKALERER